MTKKLVGWLLETLGGVDAAESSRRIAALKAKLDEAKSATNEWQRKAAEAQRLAEATAARSDHATLAARQLQWANIDLSEFVEPHGCPGALVKKTLQLRADFVDRDALAGLGLPQGFAGGVDAFLLYWAVAFASTEARDELLQLGREDAVTDAFVAGLGRWLKEGRALFGGSLEMASARIYDKLKPALQEYSVGSDLLLMVSGEGLIPGGGLRLLWLQFKRADEAQPWRLDVWRKPKEGRRTQFEALSAMHQKAYGSFAMYALAAGGRPFLASATPTQCPVTNSRESSACVVDIGDAGQRLQELLVHLSSSKKYGQFKTESDVLAIIDAAAEQQTMVPLQILGMSSGRELVPVKSLVRTVQRAYEKRLENYWAKTYPDHSLSRELGRSRDGPSLG